MAVAGVAGVAARLLATELLLAGCHELSAVSGEGQSSHSPR
jgi:hypothetical protein